MGGLTKDFHVTVRVKNGRIIARMRELGYPSVVALARAAGANHMVVGDIIRFQRLPYGRNDWLPVSYAISSALQCEPEDLWPEHIAKLKARSGVMSFEADLSEVESIASMQRNEYLDRANLTKMLGLLRDREKEVIKARFGFGRPEMTCKDIGKELGVSLERVRQIEHKALRKMRDYTRKSELAAVNK